MTDNIDFSKLSISEIVVLKQQLADHFNKLKEKETKNELKLYHQHMLVVLVEDWEITELSITSSNTQEHLELSEYLEKCACETDYDKIYNGCLELNITLWSPNKLATTEERMLMFDSCYDHSTQEVNINPEIERLENIKTDLQKKQKANNIKMNVFFNEYLKFKK